MSAGCHQLTVRASPAPSARSALAAIMVYFAARKNEDMASCKVMGIVNVTPDSFSDGGKFNSPEEAIRRARNLAAEGAAIIDVGGESTRPGAVPITWEEEWSRIEPVLRGLRSDSQSHGSSTFNFSTFNFQLSVDTYHPETAERAVAAGATIVNCVYEEPVADMIRICEKGGAELVVPAKWMDGPHSRGGGLPAERMYIDPMVGFGTTREEDLELLRAIPELAHRQAADGREGPGEGPRRQPRDRSLGGARGRERRKGARREGDGAGAEGSVRARGRGTALKTTTQKEK